MRSIEVSTDVFSAIWSHRFEGEESENEILRRLLTRTDRNTDFEVRPDAETQGRKLWRDDVREGLERLGGRAPLDAIYKVVREIRLRSGRRIPKSIDAIIRRELEYNSSDSESFTGRFDWFYSVDGIGAGVWGIRSDR